MKRLLLPLLLGLALLVPLAPAATTANEYYLTKRNAANTANEQKTVVPTSGQVLKFDGSLNPVGLTLGGAALLDVGTTTGTVAAGDDSRITTAVPTTRTVNGHALSSNVTVTPTDLSLVIGTDVQAYDADLTTYAGITPSANVQTLLGAASYAAFKTSLSLNNVDNTSDSTKNSASATLTNKTLTAPVLSGTVTGTYTLGGTPTFPSSVATLTGSQTLTNKTLTSPVIATISNTGTVTLPTATDTLVGRATTDTLTNKTISGASNTLTVRLANDVSGTLPVANGGTGGTTQAGAATALGTFGSAWTVEASDFSVTTSDRGKIFWCTSDLTVTVPSASSFPAGFFFTVISQDNHVTVSASEDILNGQSVVLVSDGAAWWPLYNFSSVQGGKGMSLNFISTSGFDIVIDAANRTLMDEDGNGVAKWTSAEGGGLGVYSPYLGSWGRFALLDDGWCLFGDDGGQFGNVSISPAAAGVNAGVSFNYLTATRIYDFPDRSGILEVLAVGAAPASSGTVSLGDVPQSVIYITPSGDCTFDASGGATGGRLTIEVVTSGTTSRTLTFGTGFKSTGTLLTGVLSGKTFTVSFVFDGSLWLETSRTTAM